VTCNHQASTHDLKKVSTTIGNSNRLSKFSAVLKFSTSSYKDTPNSETVKEIITNRQLMEAGQSRVALDNTLSQSAIGTLKDTLYCLVDIQIIISNSNLSVMPVIDSIQSISSRSSWELPSQKTILKKNYLGHKNLE